MLPRGHTIASGVICVFVGAYFKSIGCAIASLASGIFIDIDHIFDYYANHGFTLDPKAVYDVCRDMKLKKLYILMHSYEFIALFWLAIYAYSLPDIWKAVAIGFTQHLLLDQLTNPIKTPGYFIIYRLVHKFNGDYLLQK